MANLILNGSTSGSVTLSSPAVSGTTTLTLPTTSGTVLTNGTNTNFPAGSVLQVVNATSTNSVSTTSASYTDTGLSASITPKSSSSKVLVIVSMGRIYSDATATYPTFNLVRGATQILEFDNITGYGAGAAAGGATSTNYLDSPATTSSTTYKVQFKRSAGSGTVQIGWNVNATATMTLMEIAA